MVTEFEQGFVKEITRKSVDFDRWYTDVVRKAEVADYSPVRGCMVIRPYGWALWENVRDQLDRMIKDTGHENMSFPMLIPQSYLLKEAEHVEGFNPQVAWVTRGGAKELEEPLAIRPTSEAIIGPIMRRYIHSHRDLPVLVNQWANVVRWEMRTRLFLRTMEFFWQEGHTFHQTMAEADAETSKMLDVYRVLSEEWLAIPVIPGRKSEAEKFPGADYTLCIEGMMSDGLALQMGTSHNLGQNFTRAYDVTFTDRENTRQNPYGTSWGVSTRIIGAVFMAHGDDSGLVMPPRVAPIQVVIVPVGVRDAASAEVVHPVVDRVEGELRAQGVRVRVDRREELTPGFKFNEWELKGVPIRLEIGPRDVQSGSAVLVRRVDRDKRSVQIAGLAQTCLEELEAIHRLMYERALEHQRSNTHALEDYSELSRFFASGATGFVHARWCGQASCETRVKDETGATIRCLPLSAPADPGPCAVCGASAENRVIWARAY